MEIKYLEDYLDKMCEKYPEISKVSMQKILAYGLRSMYLHNLYGADTLHKIPTFTMYCGKLFTDDLRFYKYWKMKTTKKLRIMWNKRRPKYDGYYYFGLTDKQYQELLSQQPHYGRKKKKFKFTKVRFHKILEEVEIAHQFKHVFRIPYPEDVGFTIWKENCILRDFEYIYRRRDDNTLEPISDEKRNK